MALYKTPPDVVQFRSKFELNPNPPFTPPPNMTQSDFHVGIACLVAPSKQVKDSDRQLECALALFEKHRAVMDPSGFELAQSLLQ